MMHSSAKEIAYPSFLILSCVTFSGMLIIQLFLVQLVALQEDEQVFSASAAVVRIRDAMPNFRIIHT